MNYYLLPFLLALTGFMIHLSRSSKEEKEIGNEKNWAKWILHITLIISFAALAFYYLGFMVYVYGGSFYGVFDFIYLFFHSISDSILMGLLIFIAFGWTIIFTSNLEFDLYIPISKYVPIQLWCWPLLMWFWLCWVKLTMVIMISITCMTPFLHICFCSSGYLLLLLLLEG